MDPTAGSPREDPTGTSPAPGRPRPLRRLAFRIGLATLFGAATLQWLAARAPGQVERWYAQGLYPGLARFLQRAVGALPFSVAEVLLALLAVGGGFLALRASVAVVRGQQSLKGTLLAGLQNSVMVIGPGYLAFLVLWGFHYQRPALADQAGLPVVKVQPEDLAQLAEALIHEANQLRTGLLEDDQGVMRLRSREAALARAPEALQEASRLVALGPARGPIRTATVSPVMSALGITGIFFPFTGEPHINDDYLDAGLPFVACHELAHQAGFAREDEANFLAYFACRDHQDPAFRYSGRLIALRYLLAILSFTRPDLFEPLEAALSEAVRRDCLAIEAFWERYTGPVESVSATFQDTYLRVQGQEDGVLSYGRMVDLMIAERHAGRE